MTVQELIIELLNYNMDAIIDVDVDTKEESHNISDFSISTDNRYLTLTVDTDDYVLVDKKEYEYLKDSLLELDN